MSDTGSVREINFDWGPSFESPWIARMPTNTAWGRGLWNDMNEMVVEKCWNEICGKWKLEKPEENPTQTPFNQPRNPHGVTEYRTRDPSDGRRESNLLRQGAAFLLYKGWIESHSAYEQVSRLVVMMLVVLYVRSNLCSVVQICCKMKQHYQIYKLCCQIGQL